MEAMIWGATERLALGEMWLSGDITADEIARQMRTTVAAVRTKAGRLGLPDARSMRHGRPAGTMRPCMCCRAPFYSECRHNSLCVECKRGDD